MNDCSVLIECSVFIDCSVLIECSVLSGWKAGPEVAKDGMAELDLAWRDDVGFEVSGLGFRVWRLGFRVQGLGFRV